MHLLVSLGIATLLSAVLFMFRNRLGLFWSSVAFYVLTVLFVMYGFDPAAPASVVKMYCAVALCAMVLYVTSSDAALNAFWDPMKRLMVEPGKRPMLYAVLVLVPGLVAWQSYGAALPSSSPPPRVRSIHPSPPSSISFQGPEDAEAIEFDVLQGNSPVRAIETSDPDAFSEAVEHGKTVYYENCYFCHGDTLAADGHYADAVKPPPANFTDPGTIAMLTEGFLFWRVAKGGPGLPKEGTPWDSTMPAWELFLDQEDIWSAITFLYDYTGYRPRTNEAHGDEGHGDEGHGEEVQGGEDH